MPIYQSAMNSGSLVSRQHKTPNISFLTETNSMSHFRTVAWPAWLPFKHLAHLRCCIFSPQHTGDLSPAPTCFLQVTPHGLVISVIMQDEPTQVLENFHHLQLLPVCTKHVFEGALGMHSSLMLTFPLPPPLTQPCAVVTSAKVLHRHLQSTKYAHCSKEREPLIGMHTRSWGCCIRKCQHRLNLVPEWLPHCGTGGHE